MKIQKLMTVAVRTCRPNDPLNAAAQAMWEGDLGCLPVVDEACKLVGMITDRDLAMAAHLRGAPLWALAVGDAMASVVYTVNAKDSVRDAARTMTQYQLRRLPVLDAEGQLCGIVTLGGLARAAAEGQAGLSAKELAAVLAAVSGPRPAPAEAALVVDVVREEAPAPKNVLKPAPRKSSSKPAPKPSAKPKKKARVSR